MARDLSLLYQLVGLAARPGAEWQLASIASCIVAFFLLVALLIRGALTHNMPDNSNLIHLPSQYADLAYACTMSTTIHAERR